MQKLPKIFHSKILMLLALAILLSVGFIEFNQWKQRQEINKEINHLVEQQKSLEQKNLDLEQSLQYFSSDPYKEKLAREQLGLQKEGEIVINFPKIAEQVQSPNDSSQNQNNLQKWWEYIFLQQKRKN